MSTRAPVATAVVIILFALVSGCSPSRQKTSPPSDGAVSTGPLRLEKTFYSDETSGSAVARLNVVLRRSVDGTVSVEASLTNLTRGTFWTSPGNLLQVTSGGELLAGTLRKPLGTGPDIPTGESLSWSAEVRPSPSGYLTLTVADWHFMVPPGNPDPVGPLTVESQAGSISVSTSVASIPVVR